MRTKYQLGEDVPTDVLCKRLDVLSDAVTKGRSSIERNFGMSVPARHEHDADLVLLEAADRLERLETMLECQHENIRNICIRKIQRTKMTDREFRKGEVIAVRESEDPKAYWRYDTFQGMTEYGLYKTSLWRYPFARKLNTEEKGDG